MEMRGIKSKGLVWFFGVALGLAAMLTYLPYVTAAIINIPTDQPNIQTGINAAVNGDTVLVADGVYSGNLNFFGKAITVKSKNGPLNCIIDCLGWMRGFSFTNGEGNDSQVDGFTIKNAFPGYRYPGGGIDCRYSSPSITNCIISGCSGWFGSAIYCNHSSPDITNCIIKENSSQYGIIYISNWASPNIINCAIKENSGTPYSSPSKYVINCFSSSSPNIINCTITENYCTAISIGYSSYSSPSIINCTISGNNGCGISSGNLSFASIVNCILWGNSSGEIWKNEWDTYPIVTFSDIQGGYPGEGNIKSDPLFVDITNGDYHLQTDSPCIDAGITGIRIPINDIDGNLRDDNPDLGAYENIITDLDGDGVLDEDDNCPGITNPNQADADNDGMGDVCDLDDDNDGVLDTDDNCLQIPNPDQADLDEDGAGDVCDPDRDGDGIFNDIDNCPDENSSEQDANADGCIDTIDNMPQLIKDLNLPKGNENSLIKLIYNVQKSIDKDNIQAAINQLEAFINKVLAQSGKKISEENADMLIQYAVNLINSF